VLVQRKLEKKARFCWNCNNDQSKNGPPDWSEKSSSACSSSQVTSFGRSQTQKRKAMSFESFVSAKSSEKSEKQACDFRSKKKASKKDDNMEVTINVGLKRFNDEDLKTVRGKRLPITVLANATYATKLEKAVAKWKARRLTGDLRQPQSMSLYEDGTHALFMPGSCFKVIIRSHINYFSSYSGLCLTIIFIDWCADFFGKQTFPNANLHINQHPE